MFNILLVPTATLVYWEVALATIVLWIIWDIIDIKTAIDAEIREEKGKK